MDRVSGIKRLETDDTMEVHMHKAVPLRPAVNRVERLSVAALNGLRPKVGGKGSGSSLSGNSGGSGSGGITHRTSPGIQEGRDEPGA